jgi:cell division septum initiation protein DivIVA
VRFSPAIRGYNRRQVDEHVTRVNRIIAELQITAAPESAIRHALAQVSEETKSLLESAHRTAEQITGRSQSEADERIQRAAQEAKELRDAAEQKARQLSDSAATEAQQLRETAAREAREIREAAQQEARKVREAAEARVRELEADAQAIATRRVRLIDGLRELTRGLDAYLDDAEARHPDVQGAESPSQPQEQRQPQENA